MTHYIVIHQKNKLPDLKDEYESEEAAKKALREISEQVNANPSGMVLTPSGKASFRAADFAGVEYKVYHPPQAIVRRV